MEVVSEMVGGVVVQVGGRVWRVGGEEGGWEGWRSAEKQGVKVYIKQDQKEREEEEERSVSLRWFRDVWGRSY